MTYYFQNLFTEDGVRNEDSVSMMVDPIPYLVTADFNEALLKLINKDEVKQAVFGLDLDSSLGVMDSLVTFTDIIGRFCLRTSCWQCRSSLLGYLSHEL